MRSAGLPVFAPGLDAANEVALAKDTGFCAPGASPLPTGTVLFVSTYEEA